MDMRRILGTTLAAALLCAAPAAAQQPLVTLGGDFTLAFTGDDLEGLDKGLGISGGMLFPMGPISFVGFEGGWSDVSFDDSDASGSLIDIVGVARIGVGYGERVRPYVDIRAGYGRLSFEEGVIDGNVDGPSAGGSVGFMARAGGVWLDVHGRYQHHWFKEADVEGFGFDTDVSGGRMILGAGVNIPLGG